MGSFDIGRAFKAPFDDPDWVNRTLMGFVWTLLVVTAPAVYGAQLDYIRKVSRGDERLPDWDDFGGKWVEGFMLGVAGFIYFLPALVLGGISIVPALVAAVAEGDSSAVGALAGGGMCLFGLVMVVYAVGMSIFFSAAMTHYAMRGSFGAFFEFGAILSRIRGGSGYFTAWLYVLLISMALSTVTSFVSGLTGGLGGIVTPAFTYLGMMMMGHVLGQWARQAYPQAAPVGHDPTVVPPPPAPPAG